MKRTLTLFILALTAWSASAQHQINFHQGAATYSYPLTEGDSLYFDSSNATMYFLNNGTLLPFVVGTIDSITATPANSQAVYIHYQGSSVTVTNPLASSGVSVTDSGAFVTINAAGGLDDIQYICWGATSNGNLKIYSDSRFNLLLRGLSISNPVGPALNIQSKKAGTIHLGHGTANSLSDGLSYAAAPVVNGSAEDQKGALFSEGQLIFTGSGSLSVHGLGSSQHALASDKGIIVQEGNIIVTSAAKDGIHGKEGFYMYGGEISVASTGDGIDGDEGEVVIHCGSLSIQSTSNDVKAISADMDIIVNGGSINLNIQGDQSKGISSNEDIHLNGGTITATASGAVVLEPSGSGYDPSYCTVIKADGDLHLGSPVLHFTTNGQASRGLSCDGNAFITGGSITIASSGNGGSYTNASGTADAYTGICLKADQELSITGGTLTFSNSGSGGRCISVDSNILIGDGFSAPVLHLTTTGSSIALGGGEYHEAKALKSDRSVTVRSGTVTVASADDGIKAGDSLTIEGGNINILSSVEGMEAPYLTFNGGNVRVNSSDDALNATFGLGGEFNDGSELAVNGGYIYLNSTNGDPLDGNGDLTVTGGTLVVHGPQSAPEVGMDVNGAALVSGGFVIISGTNSNMTEGFHSNSAQYSLLMKTSQSISSTTLIHLEDAAGNEVFTFKPNRNYASIVFSSPVLANGTTYKLYTGGTHSGTVVDGLYSGGAYTSGTLKKTFTISGKVTTFSF